MRLLLSVLALLMALPATAAPACHDAVPGRTAAMHHHGDEAPRTPAAAVAHDCIGCIPPADWLSSTVAAPVIAGAERRRAPGDEPPHGHALRPTPPPPRQA